MRVYNRRVNKSREVNERSDRRKETRRLYRLTGDGSRLDTEKGQTITGAGNATKAGSETRREKSEKHKVKSFKSLDEALHKRLRI